MVMALGSSSGMERGYSGAGAPDNGSPPDLLTGDVPSTYQPPAPVLSAHQLPASPTSPRPSSGGVSAKQLQQLLLALGDMQRDLDSSQQHQLQQSSALEQFQVVSELLCSQMQALTSTLAARDKMVEALMKKQNELVSKIATQDDEIVDKNCQIQDLENKLGMLSGGSFMGGSGASTLEAAAGRREDPGRWSKMFKNLIRKDGKDDSGGISD
mmetsp:Transcript_23305/g.51159  ORF Transcript_23305/g.51159 Transcript_23305/m.51159 type:complete len:212 (+) Transcript_23305:436-1071(+)